MFGWAALKRDHWLTWLSMCVFSSTNYKQHLLFTNLKSWLVMFGLVDPGEYDKLPLYVLNASHDPNNIHTQCCSDSGLHYLPESRLLDSGCPLPSRRVLPCNFRWSGLREKGRSADGWCKEKSFWMTCKPSPQGDQQEPLSLLEDEDDANEWEVSFLQQMFLQKTAWWVTTSACVAFGFWSWNLLRIHSRGCSLVLPAADKDNNCWKANSCGCSKKHRQYMTASLVTWFNSLQLKL